jgi:hypothetical protein
MCVLDKTESTGGSDDIYSWLASRLVSVFTIRTYCVRDVYKKQEWLEQLDNICWLPSDVLNFFYVALKLITHVCSSAGIMNRFILEKHVLLWDDESYPLTYKLNKHDTNKSFTLVVFEPTEKGRTYVFYCRLYYINVKRRRQIGVDPNIRYELEDVFLMPAYQGISFQGVKYSKICLGLIDQFLAYENIHNLVLWTWKDHIRAIKRYQDLGFVSLDQPKVLNYYMKVAKRTGISEDQVCVFIRTQSHL